MHAYKWSRLITAVGVCLAMSLPVLAAYNHNGDTDSVNFRSACPDKTGTKLDSCNLCHTGGSYTSSGKTVTLGSCQWCHYSYGYNAPHGDITTTLNPYGKDYLANGRNAAAIVNIAALDSDGDGYTNAMEIAAARYPGDPSDDPSKVTAPYRVFTRRQLEAMPQYSQFILMNATKSDDYYARYSGVLVSKLLDKAGMLPSANGINVIAPDGFSYSHPLHPASGQYHVVESYPDSQFYYDEQADMAKNAGGWCDYSAPSVQGKTNGDPITGLRMLLAIKRDGELLAPGVLNTSNKLDGEGPYRLVPPQIIPGPPDQRSTASNQNVIWPFSNSNDHNAGAATRSATIIKVNPLPPGTTDINLYEAGWNYVDNAQLVVYGAISPLPNIYEKFDQLLAALRAADPAKFRHPLRKKALLLQISATRALVAKGKYQLASMQLERNMRSTDGCGTDGAPDDNDWITDCDLQKSLYWSLNEIVVLLKILV